MIYGMQLFKVYACVSTKYSYCKVGFVLMELQQLTSNFKKKAIVFTLYFYDHQNNVRYGNIVEMKNVDELKI